METVTKPIFKIAEISEIFTSYCFGREMYVDCDTTVNYLQGYWDWLSWQQLQTRISEPYHNIIQNFKWRLRQASHQGAN